MKRVMKETLWAVDSTARYIGFFGLLTAFILLVVRTYLFLSDAKWLTALCEFANPNEPWCSPTTGWKGVDLLLKYGLWQMDMTLLFGVIGLGAFVSSFILTLVIIPRV